jgi:hypothetical protein
LRIAWKVLKIFELVLINLLVSEKSKFRAKIEKSSIKI